MIYFDNAATTYPKPQCVYDAVNYATIHYGFNAGRGEYSQSSETFKMIEETRKKVGSLVGLDGSRVVFLSSATEALSIIIRGLDLNENDIVFVSPFEHNAVIRNLALTKVKIKIIPFNDDWSLNEDLFESQISFERPKAIFASQISNVTGFELPYEKIFSISNKFKCVNVLDAAQGFGEYEIKNIKDINYIVFAGHKTLHGIFGVGGFVICNDTNLKITKAGGTGSDSLNPNMPSEIPYKYESGSYNSIAIYSLFSSIDFLKNNNNAIIKQELVKYFIKKTNNLSKLIIYKPLNENTSGIVSFNIKGYTSEEVGEILYNDFNICVRTGYHCAPFVHDFINSKLFLGTVRASFGMFNTKEEIDVLVNVIKGL